MIRKSTKCDICNSYISLSNIGKHTGSESCARTANRISGKMVIFTPDGLAKCLTCERVFSRLGIGSHVWRNHTDSGLKHNANTKIWNKGLTKFSDERVMKYSITLASKPGSTRGMKYNLTPERRRAISERMSLHPGSGKAKWATVIHPSGYEVKVQGTWEARFSSVLSIIDPDWIKPGLGNRGHSFKWVDSKGMEHTYTPDFYSPKLGKYFEIKGYWWHNDREKMNRVIAQNSLNIEIIHLKELEYYENKYT